VWGGEFLLGDTTGYTRVAHLRPFLLPGGEAAVREPRRVALALLWELFGEAALERDDLAPVRAFGAAERRLLARMMEQKVNTPTTTSAGRLFDGVAALIGLRQTTTFEGQAAMGLEGVADPTVTRAYPLPLVKSSDGGATPMVLDWWPLVEGLLRDLQGGVSQAIMAAQFHNALGAAIGDVARAVGEPCVALTGGCFQNRLLTTQTVRRLREDGFGVLLQRQVPPNDGGISLGQVMVAAAAYQAKNKQYSGKNGK
jgi:hydrogenase maturation protein HypF